MKQTTLNFLVELVIAVVLLIVFQLGVRRGHFEVMVGAFLVLILTKVLINGWWEK